MQRMESKGNGKSYATKWSGREKKWSCREKKSGDSRNGKSYATKEANTSKFLGRSREHFMSHWQ